jgi:hypothetical protein
MAIAGIESLFSHFREILRRDMMKFSYGSILLVIVIFTAVLVSGCTCSKSFEIGNTGTPTPGAQTGTATPAASKAPSGGLSTLGSAMDFSKIKWYEYQTISSTPGEQDTKMNMRMDYNVEYNGQAAEKVSMNMETRQDATITNMITEVYSDKSGNSLGGHMKTLQNGEVVFEMDIPASSGSSGSGDSSGSNLIGKNSGAGLTNLGVETVTVPAGTYLCTKYTYGDAGNMGTVWVAANVPLPVKVQGKSGQSTVNMELVGWG